MQNVHNRCDIQPVWVRDLLGLWASGEARAGSQPLGWAPVSPMFARLGAPEETDSDGSYGAAEVLAMRLAVERLHAELPGHWLALRDALAGRQLDPACHALVAAAGQLLAEWVDLAIDGPA